MCRALIIFRQQDKKPLSNHCRKRRTQSECPEPSPKRLVTSYSCITCKKEFSQAVNLEVHERSHSGFRPFACPYPSCGKEFTQLGNMQLHVKIHEGNKAFSCQQCGKSFVQKGNLEVHMRIHTGTKPFRCAFCKRSFRQVTILNHHMRTHTHETPYTCHVCKLGFKQLSNLNEHIFNTHNGFLFPEDLDQQKKKTSICRDIVAVVSSKM